MKITRNEVQALTSLILDHSRPKAKNHRAVSNEARIANLALSKLEIAVRVNGRGYFELPDHANFDLLALSNRHAR